MGRVHRAPGKPLRLTSDPNNGDLAGTRSIKYHCCHVHIDEGSTSAARRKRSAFWATRCRAASLPWSKHSPTPRDAAPSACSAPRRMPLAPQVPPFIEQIFKGYERLGAGTSRLRAPQPAIDKVGAAGEPAVVAADQGFESAGGVRDRSFLIILVWC